VTAEASSDRLALASQAGSLSLALDAADTIQAISRMSATYQQGLLTLQRKRTGGNQQVTVKHIHQQLEPIERVRARLDALVKANAAPRCGTRSKRTGLPCRAAAMPNGRCKVHGGKSTGPRTPEGLERSRRANWKHGYYCHKAKAERSRVRAATLALRYLRKLGH
jgi:hypothetical protein